MLPIPQTLSHASSSTASSHEPSSPTSADKPEVVPDAGLTSVAGHEGVLATPPAPMLVTVEGDHSHPANSAPSPSKDLSTKSLSPELVHETSADSLHVDIGDSKDTPLLHTDDALATTTKEIPLSCTAVSNQDQPTEIPRWSSIDVTNQAYSQKRRRLEGCLTVYGTTNFMAPAPFAFNTTILVSEAGLAQTNRKVVLKRKRPDNTTE